MNFTPEHYFRSPEPIISVSAVTLTSLVVAGRRRPHTSHVIDDVYSGATDYLSCHELDPR